MKRIAKKMVPAAFTKRMSGKKKKGKTKDGHPINEEKSLAERCFYRQDNLSLTSPHLLAL